MSPEQNESRMTNQPIDFTDAYAAAVKRPAEVVHDYRSMAKEDEPEQQDIIPRLVEEILPDESKSDRPMMAFIIANVLSKNECDKLIETAENYGIVPAQKYAGTLRTAKRTSQYKNKTLSNLVESRVRSILKAKFQEDEEDNIKNDKKIDSGDKNNDDQYMGPFGGIHDNWRVLRYDADSGDSFPPHQDQMDSYQTLNKETGTKEFFVSSHTLLINLSNDEKLVGGFTRFYPKAKLRPPTIGSKKKKNEDNAEKENAQDNEPLNSDSTYDYAVDVVLPKGWAIAFRQKGLLHAGQPIDSASPCPKYVAQAGVLRVLPKRTVLRPSIFRLGPNLTKEPFREYK